MDAKLFSTQTLNLSGMRLFVLLTIGLSTFALIADEMAGRSLAQVFSLTLPFWFCAVSAAGLGFWAVPSLRALKAGQVIREDGPKSHLKKAGTPTMGGVFFLPVALLVALIWSGFSASVVAVSVLTLAYGAIGWIDDWQIIRGCSNKGITPRMKLLLQVGVGSLFCLWLAWTQPATITTVALPLGFMLPLGFFFWVVAVFVLAAESNATNLTDGVDGLAGGTVAIALLGLGALIGPTSPELMLFCACLSGSCLGFLLHNRNPARVFMGNTGSTALGGALAGVALLTNSLFALLILSGLFLIETLSVMLQVGYYKATKGPDGIGKRFFKMSPYHNHLELSGWSETRIVAAFYVIAGLLSFVTLAVC
ncbi:phospho-N-acetylmuramoyl-pentapeptide-transferase [Stenomitos frigidus]|uniref:Phospho-N-acetylmuramoyl-pentapeptide-transferase n=1 Tax=Stenomitos frigidus ULC18 TaxID=2107698 RepID=A0A2T1DTS2_9CYAN|nr:phospho-N-acetylmuramoyl-pentapeptide-transferase [Stenomitos frigidus]PSB23897.1 phospho-N-acetylmuramoyl-pentapeptide-transferase [Stenomitos frigidus ULC18]